MIITMNNYLKPKLLVLILFLVPLNMTRPLCYHHIVLSTIVMVVTNCR